MKPFVIIIRGPSGVGKSSVSHALSDILKKKIKRIAYLPVDVSIYPFMRNYSKLSKKERWDIAQENLEMIFENFLKRKFTIIIDGIFHGKYEGKSHLERLFKIARKHKVKTIVFELHAHLKTLHKRINERAKINKYAWRNPKDTEDRYERFMKTLHKDAIVIQTENKSTDEIVGEILKELR